MQIHFEINYISETDTISLGLRCKYQFQFIDTFTFVSAIDDLINFIFFLN